MLLEGEDVSVKVLLEFLIGKVDVKLFKSVYFKVLKTKDIQDTNKRKLVFSTANSSIDLFQDPSKDVGIQPHCSGVTSIISLVCA